MHSRNHYFCTINYICRVHCSKTGIQSPFFFFQDRVKMLMWFVRLKIVFKIVLNKNGFGISEINEINISRDFSGAADETTGQF